MARCAAYAGLLASLFLTLATLAHAQTENGNHYSTKRYTTSHAGSDPPHIDGKIDDRVWDTVEWAGDFLQWDPAEGEAPTYQTEFKILYDEDALYFAARAHDAEPDKIDSILARRDRFPGDWVELNIDSYFDHRTAFSFTASVSGTRGDEFISDDGNNWDGNWDPVWELATNVDEAGWTLEARIPMSQLRFSSAPEQVWGIQVQRRIYREGERSLWQPKTKDENGWVSRFGELHGIRGLQASRRVELLPYGLTKGETFEEVSGHPFLDGSAGQVTFGLDGKVGVTSNLTLDFTVNPDFGQVEADPSEVNLSAFETFFSERRPFFIEGNNILDFQIAPAITGGSFTADNLFYSRRIGRSPRYSPDVNDGEFFDSPQNTSILGAAKLTGKTAGGWSLGILESVTARESATIVGTGPGRSQAVEPLTNYFVGRAKKDFNGGNTRLGTMATAVNREQRDDHLRFLHDAAYTGGMDFVHQWSNKTWRFGLNSAFSHVRGRPEAIERTQTSSARYFQRPDNSQSDFDPTRTSLSGTAGATRLGRISGGNFRFETGAAWRTPGFETNDIGFLRRSDEINQFTWAGYRIEKPFSVFRAIRFNANQWVDWDFGGTNLSREFNTNFNANLKNYWSFGGGVTRGLESVSNTQLRGGPSSRWPGYTSGWVWVNSDSRKSFDYGFGGNFSDGDESSSRYRNAWMYMNYRPSNAIRVSFNPSFSRSEREMQFVGSNTFGEADRYLFGSIDQKTVNFTFRVDYSITPNLTLQYYGSPFVSSGDYGRFKRITDPHAAQYRDRFAEFSDGQIEFDDGEGAYLIDEDQDGSTDYSIGKPDFNFRQFNSNLVMRWEFQPGSTLFLVWSQARTGFVNDGRFSFGDDSERPVLGVPARRVPGEAEQVVLDVAGVGHRRRLGAGRTASLV